MPTKPKPSGSTSAHHKPAAAGRAIPADDTLEIYVNANKQADCRYLKDPTIPATVHQTNGKKKVRWTASAEFAIVFCSCDTPFTKDFFRGDVDNVAEGDVAHSADPNKKYQYAIVLFGNRKPIVSDPQIIIT